jgi:caffeoyl-CoA O-methyltransferase
MHFISSGIEQYATDHSSMESDLLAELQRETHLKVLHPRMLSGHLQGRLLSMLSKMLQPKGVLEIGTYTGYSALCLAEGLAPDGILYTIDMNDELRPIQEKYIRKAGCKDRIRLLHGLASDIIPTLEPLWDMVFIDADKENYPMYFEMLANRIRPGGLLIADNVLWSGKVLQPTEPNDRDTTGLKDFSKSLAGDPRFEVLMLPIRDGLTVARKK